MPTPRSACDQRSVFIGNLPSDTTEEQLQHVFQAAGQISSISVIRKPLTSKAQEHREITRYLPSPLDGRLNVFAFIEFQNPEQAHGAAQLQVSDHHASLTLSRR